MKIRFCEVGRGKLTWEYEIPCCDDGQLDGLAMLKSIRRKNALGSRGVDFTDDGLILVGGFREVGRWEVAKEVSP